MPLEYVDRPSANFGERKSTANGHGISILVFHYTGMETCRAALDRLCDPSAEVSAHMLIDEDGTLYRLVADEKRAWHAGAAYWRGETDVNSASIGIELVNPGHEYGYQSFPEAQVTTLTEVSLDLIGAYGIPATGIVGHSDIAPGRKQDPGELFPWERLASAGVGLWPDSSSTGPNHGTPWDALAAIGYAHPSDPSRGSDVLRADSAEQDVLLAFQSRFTPANLSGVMDEQTQQAIKATAQTFA